MSTDVQKFWGQYSYRAIVCGKGLVQLGHFPANTGILFYQMDLDTHFAQIQRRLHSCYAAANYQNFIRGHYATILGKRYEIALFDSNPKPTFLNGKIFKGLKIPKYYFRAL
jgi:hypothetical protein